MISEPLEIVLEVLPNRLDRCRLTISLSHTSLREQQATELETDLNLKLGCNHEGIELQISIHISLFLENLECRKTETTEFKVQTLN